jgi:LPXTG-motif cell wall-anchored protein
VLDTDQGQRVTLLMDSRTMLPVNHAPGMGMKIEFRVLENGQYYAERLIPLDNLEVQQVSVRDEDEGEDVATSSVTRGNGNYDNDEASEAAEGSGNARDAAEDQAEANSKAATSNTALPQTASNQPLIALLGLAALAGAAILARSRREGNRAS